MTEYFYSKVADVGILFRRKVGFINHNFLYFSGTIFMTLMVNKMRKMIVFFFLFFSIRLFFKHKSSLSFHRTDVKTDVSAQ